MRAKLLFTLAVFLAFGSEAGNSAVRLHSRKRKRVQNERVAVVTIDSGLAQCKVDLDGAPQGITGNTGRLTIHEIVAGDHYLHVQCPGRPGVSYFLAPHGGEELEVNIQAAETGKASADVSPLEAAAAKERLRRMVRQAVQLRASGDFQQTVKLLREATSLDPKNSDLHRELGITFLLAHDWERARVEMLEAIHHDPDNAEAHSGLAYAYEKLGDLQKALKEYRICTHLEPDDVSYRSHYVEVLGEIVEQQAQRKH
jgi:hypothetical protein